MEYNYNYLNNYLKNKFGERVLKICVDGGFTCPNRDGTLSTSGCIFCSQAGSGERLHSKENISKQVKDMLQYKSERANKFIVFFQNFTNTYDSIENLKKKYDMALIDKKIVGIAIATRPDCINKEVIELLKEYKQNYYIWVELGLQTSNDNTGKLINRCYNTNNFALAVKMLNEANIDVVTHIMVGLPGESFEDIKSTIDFINKQNVQGIKIHSTYIVKNTILEKMYLSSKYKPITFDYYMECLIYIITHLRKDIIIHRFSGDAPKDLLVAPEWTGHKKRVMNELNKRLKNENLYQGIFYS